MKIQIILFVILLSNSYAVAQKIRVVDQDNSSVFNVAVFNADKSKSAVSNAEGMVDLSIFADSTQLLFQHPSYQHRSLVKWEITNDVVQLKEQVFEMTDVVVSANKWEQDVSEIPNVIVSIESESIEKNNPQTSADLLAQSGEVFVQKSQLGGGSPKIRGFSANSTLIVIDGVRMNNAIYRSGNLQNVISIDPNSIEGAEVIMGPGSVIYGSDALGGVMDFHTKRLRFNSALAGESFIRYSSANDERTGHIDIRLGSKRLSSFSSFTYSSFGHLKTGGNRSENYPDFGKRPFYTTQDGLGADVLVENSNENEQIESGYEAWQMVQKFGYQASKKLQFTYGLYFSNTSDIPRYDRLTEPSNDGQGLAHAEWFYGPQTWLMHSLRAELKSESKIFDQARMVAAHQDYEEKRNDRGFGDDRLRIRTENVNVYSLNVDFDKGIPGDHSLFYGLEVLYNDVESDAIRKNINTNTITNAVTRYPNGGSQYYAGSAYASYIHRLPNFVFSGGLRFNRVGLEAKTSDPNAFFTNADRIELTNSAINGSFGTVYRGFSNQKISWNFSTGFRAPNVDDVGKVFEIDENDIIVPNQNLKPETSYNTELGWSGSKNSFTWRFTTFFTYLNDAIVRGPFQINGQDSIQIEGATRRIFAQTNVGEALIFGGSLALYYQLSKRIQANLNITETAGEERSSKQPLRHTTPVFGRFSIRYEHKKNNVELFTEFNGNRFRDDIPLTEIESKPYLYAAHSSNASQDGSPGWVTLNVRIRHQLSKNLVITSAIENIFDTHYRPYSSGISAPGRNFIIAVRGSL
ncbi:MAG: TonB-dependent receptor [Bacteroidota bacterium]